MIAPRPIYSICLKLYLALLCLAGFYISATTPIWGWDALSSWMPRAYERLESGFMAVEHRHGVTLTALYSQITSLFYPLLSSSESISAIIFFIIVLKLTIISRLFAILKLEAWAGLATGFLLFSMPLGENLTLSVGYSEVFCSFFLISALAFSLESAVKPSLTSITCLAGSVLLLISLRNTGFVYAATALLCVAPYICLSRVRKKLFWGFAFSAFTAVFIALFVEVIAGSKRVNVGQYIVGSDLNEISVESKNACGATFANESLQVRFYPTDPSRFRSEHSRDYMPVSVDNYGHGVARINHPGYILQKVWLKAPESKCSSALERFVYFPDLTVRFFSFSIMIFADNSITVKAFGYDLNVRLRPEFSPLLPLISAAYIENMSISITLVPIAFATMLNFFGRRQPGNCVRTMQGVFFATSSAIVIIALCAVSYFYDHSAPGSDRLFSRLTLPFLQANLFLSLVYLWQLIPRKAPLLHA